MSDKTNIPPMTEKAKLAQIVQKAAEKRAQAGTSRVEVEASRRGVPIAYFEPGKSKLFTHVRYSEWVLDFGGLTTARIPQGAFYTGTRDFRDMSLGIRQNMTPDDRVGIYRRKYVELLDQSNPIAIALRAIEPRKMIGAGGQVVSQASDEAAIVWIERREVGQTVQGVKEIACVVTPDRNKPKERVLVFLDANLQRWYWWFCEMVHRHNHGWEPATQRYGNKKADIRDNVTVEKVGEWFEEFNEALLAATEGQPMTIEGTDRNFSLEEPATPPVAAAPAPVQAPAPTPDLTAPVDPADLTHELGTGQESKPGEEPEPTPVPDEATGQQARAV